MGNLTTICHKYAAQQSKMLFPNDRARPFGGVVTVSFSLDN